MAVTKQEVEAVASRILKGKTTLVAREEVERQLLQTPFAGAVHLAKDVLSVLFSENKEVYPICINGQLTKSGDIRIFVSTENEIPSMKSTDSVTPQAGKRIGHATRFGDSIRTKSKNGDGWYYVTNIIRLSDMAGIVISNQDMIDLRKVLDAYYADQGAIDSFTPRTSSATQYTVSAPPKNVVGSL